MIRIRHDKYGNYKIDELVTKDGLFITWDELFATHEEALSFIEKKGYKISDVKLVNDNWKIEELLKKHGVTKYEITNERYGNSHHSALTRIIVYDRFVFDPKEFNLLGYGLVFRESEKSIKLMDKNRT